MDWFPKLLSSFPQFGYSFAQFTRGQRAEDGKAHLETLWISPDGTGLPTLYDAYASGLFLSYQEFRKNMQRHYPDDMASVRVIRELIVKRRQDDSLSSHHLLIVGIDHAEPRENLLEVMEFLRREIPEAEFLYSTQQAYFEAMAAEMSGRLPISSGEQRGPYESTFSSPIPYLPGWI